MTSSTRGWELGLAAAGGALASSLAMYLSMRRRRQRIRRVATSFVPTWSPGDTQQQEVVPPASLTLAPEDLKSKYNFFISAYVPRPIALVSSISYDGLINIAPFSYSGIVNHDPGTIVFSCVDKRKGGGDTLKNVKATREFVVHVVSEWYVEAANHTCGNFAPDVNEFESAGLRMISSTKVKPPRAAEAALAMECRVDHIIPMHNDTGAVTATMVVGRVVLIHVHEPAFDADKGVVLPEKLRPMARLGGNTYSTIGDIFDIARPKVISS
ncbi:hypothetical protein CTAYLR_009232 [Chrysophaeum taylorii]|uniref:Flavin reductase like domain-containing protein n=1 Tax=Chrysophaeum taylorii TaxID=2483200 RepID=A0AAD7UH49_9STRA|nr:hypothetical protein CTAYLR_009232 [Chrysophaeum taylorii]